MIKGNVRAYIKKQGGRGCWHVKREGEVYASRPINPEIGQRKFSSALASQKRRRGISTTRASKNERGRRAGTGSDSAGQKSTVPGLPDCDAADFNDGGVRAVRQETAVSQTTAFRAQKTSSTILKGAKMKIVNKHVNDLIPYVNNPRLNDNAVDAVASSIKNFGFKV